MEGETEPRSDVFERVLDTHGDALWRLAGAYTDEPRDREDLYQEILVAVWQGLARFRRDSSMRTYVFRIGRNRAISFQQRSRKHAPAESLEPVADGGPSPAENAIARDEQARLRRAVRALPPPGREVVSISVTARRLGRSSESGSGKSTATSRHSGKLGTATAMLTGTMCRHHGTPVPTPTRWTGCASASKMPTG